MIRSSRVSSVICLPLFLAPFLAQSTALFFSAAAGANVSLKNGNFFIGYTDIVYPGGLDDKIERVCNSKTSFSGMFGPCWGNEYQGYLTVSADGSVVVHEYGGGAENRFSPVAFNNKELEGAVNQIADAAAKAGSVSGTQLSAYKQHLRADADFRNDQWDLFLKQGKLKARHLAEGTQLHSNRFSYQYITKVASGYIRSFDSGKVETYDESGKLTRVKDKNGNFIDLTYNKEGHLAKLVDNFNRKMFFYFNDKGLLDHIEGENGKVAKYTYNSWNELVSSKDVDGNVYTYRYDAKQHHNLTEIGYANKTSQVITYYGPEQMENVKSVKDPDGSLTTYTYKEDRSDKGHLTVALSSKDSSGKTISTSQYEYFTRHKADGEEWTYKLVTTLDGDRTETTYNECCGLPLLIKSGGEETSFEYDAKGHVTKKITPTEVTQLGYDPKVSKVSRVDRYSKTDKKDKGWSTFLYDDKGNLRFAKNSEGKGVELFYDSVGRIKSMIDQSKRRINFKYNENSKPVEISDPAVGAITVSYTNSGEIKKVESSAGRKIAMQVTSAFQNLLDIIRPAGVSLSL